MYSINSFSVNRLNNAEFVAFFINLANLIERYEASKLGLDTSVVTNFAAKKNQLVDQVRISAASELTAKLNAAHDKRMRMFKIVNYTLRKVEVSEDSAVQALAEKVTTLILNVYPLGILRLPQQELTTVLSGFIYDMKNKFSEDDLDDLDVTTELTDLETANQEFIATYSERAAQRAESVSSLTQQLRQEMMDLYLGIGFIVQYYANSTLEANAEKAATGQTFIGVLNEMIDDAKSRYQQRMNALHAGSDANAEGGNAEGGASGSNATEGGNEQPAGGNTPASGGNEQPSGGNTPAGNDQPSGGNENPAGGNENPSGGNTDPEIDRENGTLHDGTVEY